jgi:hypothetical protein
VGEVAPVGCFTAQVIGQAAGAEIGVVVRKEKGDFNSRIEFMGAERRAYSGVAAANDD